MKNLAWVALKLCLSFAFVAGADRSMAGDPILFFSSARVKSSPIKRIDRELDRALEVPASPDPGQTAFSPAERRNREDRRQAARRTAQLRQREKASGKGTENWLVEDEQSGASGEKEDESLRRLGGEKVEEESLELLEVGESGVSFNPGDYRDREAGQVDPGAAMRAAALASSAREMRSSAIQQVSSGEATSGRASDLLDLSGLVRLRSQSDAGSARALGGGSQSGSLGASASDSPGFSPMQNRPDFSSGAAGGNPLFAPGPSGGAGSSAVPDNGFRSTRSDGIDRTGSVADRMNALQPRVGSDGFDTIMRREELRRLGR